jgi:hypothetical protein
MTIISFFSLKRERINPEAPNGEFKPDNKTEVSRKTLNSF